MGRGRKSGPIRTVFNSFRPWAKTPRCSKFQQSISKIAAYSAKNEIQTVRQTIYNRYGAFWELHTSAQTCIISGVGYKQYMRTIVLVSNEYRACQRLMRYDLQFFCTSLSKTLKRNLILFLHKTLFIIFCNLKQSCCSSPLRHSPINLEHSHLCIKSLYYLQNGQ